MTIKASRYSSLLEARRRYLTDIDQVAGKIRGRHFTDVPGQATTYEFKRQDAERYIADGRPDDTSPYPWVAAEADAMGGTASEAADKITARANRLWEAGVDIERERMRAKYAVRAAETPREMNEALEQARSKMESISAGLDS